MKSTIALLFVFILFCSPYLGAQDVMYGPADPPPKDYTLVFNGTLNDAEIGQAQGKTLYLSQFNLATTTDVYFATISDEVKISMDGESWDTNEILQFNPAMSDLSNGILVWTGTTNVPENNNTVYTKFTLVAKEQLTGNPLSLIESTPVTGNSYAGGVLPISASLAFQVNMRFDAGYSMGSLEPALDFYDKVSFGATVFSSYDYGIYWINDAPELKDLSPLQVDEGDTVWMSVDNLLVTDAESDDPDIYMELSNANPQQPQNGKLFAGNVALSEGESFTMDQLKAGEVYYIHDDSETTTDSLALMIRDGDGKYYFDEGENSQVVYIPIAITPVDDRPVITIMEVLQAVEGEDVLITNLFLKTDDPESNPDQVTYTLDPDIEAEWPKAGILQLDGVPINSGGVFTQADIDQEKISYRNLGSETTDDGFFFKVEDENGNRAIGPDELAKVFFEIAISTVNDPPVLSANSPTEADQWMETLIDENHLAATDEESDAAHITFTLETGVLVTDHGSLYRDQTQLGPEDSFTMQDILDGKIKYHNNGSTEATDGIVVSITDEDGAHASDAGFTVFTHMINITLTDLEEHPAVGFSIYPNPGSGIFKIHWNGNYDSYTLFNILGEELGKGDVRGLKELELDLRDQDKGIMIIRMFGGESSVARRIIKTQ